MPREYKAYLRDILEAIGKIREIHREYEFRGFFRQRINSRWCDKKS